MNRPEDLYPNDKTVEIDEKTGHITYAKLPAEGGTKHDNGKAPLSLVPYELLVETSKAMGYGARKYTRDNYRKGFESHRLVDACLRHVHAWQNGEDLDPESGANHLGHAAACLGMLLSNLAEGTGKDTRYKRGNK